MNNLDKSEKSKGVLLFATNTDTIDYVAIAEMSSKLISHYLQLPVTIVTSGTSNNRRLSVDTGKFESWYNNYRYSAYEQSPYDITLLLDCDYLVFNRNLLKLLHNVSGYKIAKHNNFVESISPTYMGKHSIPQLWATVIIFDKSEKSKLLFELVGKIQRNYGYYCALYNIPPSNFRNDFAFAIADNIINGYCQDIENYIPWSLTTISEPITDLSLIQNKFYLKTKDRAYVLPKQDLHIISKAFLQSTQCRELIERDINA